MKTNSAIPEGSAFVPQVQELLHAAGRGDLQNLSSLSGGANNRVWLVETSENRCLLKAYFQNPDDPRNRFEAEHLFYNYLAQAGVTASPRALGWSEENRFGLFEFVEGRKLETSEIDSARVAQASAFLSDLNQPQYRALATEIKSASEACFSVADHISTIQRRINRLTLIAPETEFDRSAILFIKDNLTPAWEKVNARIQQFLRDQSATISGDELCLSPSDFGFHNALLKTNDSLRFFDFEYSGWDDPAKLVCDFFCQPALPVSIEHWDSFTDVLTPFSFWNENAARRASILFPAYQLKWCCIMLNEFLPVDSSRRAFAGQKADENRKREQLAKAVQACSNLDLNF